MKQKLMKSILGLLAVTFVLTGCSSNEDAVSKVIEHNEYSSAVSQNRVILAQALIESLNENSQLATQIIAECNKKFDGDKDVLCKDLFEMPVSNNTSVRVKSILNGSSQIRKVKSSATSCSNTSSIISQDSLVQIYYYMGDSDSTSNSYEGIVVIPENVKERDGKDLLLIKKDGTTTYIRSDVDPDKNYLVISRNERSNFDNIPSQVSAAKMQKSATATDGKKMSITAATFTSIGAKRTFESWWGGEPEVRLNVLYVAVDQRTNAFMELRNATFMYPKLWIRNGVFKNKVQWNRSLVTCPYWYQNESYYGRRLIWTEEDGDTSETETNNEIVDPLTKIKTTIKKKIPASSNDALIADSWIDYYTTEAGELTWGSIKFVISFD